MKAIIIIPLICAMLSACGKSEGTPQADPEISFSDISVAEGNGGTNTVELSISLNHTSSKQVSLVWSTVDGSAKSGADYTAVNNQTVVFQPNEISKKLLVTVVGDDLKEADESFQVNIQNAVNGIILKSSCMVTLKNDDTNIGFNNTGFDAPTSYPGYSLAWSDEFNAVTLDATLWTMESGDGCPALCNWGNNELQYYTNNNNNLFFQDGKMLFEARAEVFGGKNYTSVRMKTQDKKAFKYGRIDIRAILPKTKGIWPAFWLMPQDNVFGTWPKSGELDMMELVGSEPSKVLGTVHYGPGPGSTYISKNKTLSSGSFNDQFHVFSLEWKEDQIQWLIDGEAYATVTKADIGNNNYPFNEKFFMIINLAVGGNLPGNPDATTVLPQWLILDYIRVYQK